MNANIPSVAGAVLSSALAFGAVLLAQVAPGPAPQPSPPAQGAGATAPPGAAVPATAVPPPAASPLADPAAQGTPTPVPTPVYQFVYRASPQPIPPPDVPAIAEIDLNANSLTPPAPLHVRVLTSIAVVSVTAQTSIAFMSRGIPIPKAQPGLFLFDGYIPDVPFFLRNHTFDVQFIATAANGRSANVSLPLRLN